MAEGLIYHMTPENLKIFMLGRALTTFVKGMKIMLRKNWLSILAEREVPLTKLVSAHPSINYFQIYWYHMIAHTFSHPYIWKFPDNVSHI